MLQLLSNVTFHIKLTNPLFLKCISKLLELKFSAVFAPLYVVVLKTHYSIIELIEKNWGDLSLRYKHVSNTVLYVN